MTKLFNIINVIFAITLSIISLNMIFSYNNNSVLPFLFVITALSHTYLGINLLNDKKKTLSIFSFTIAMFFFTIVGLNICI